MNSQNKHRLLSQLTQMYREVDAQTAELDQIHSERLNCKKSCSGCCVDGITVFEIEAENIKQQHSELLVNESPNTAGGCAFLDRAGACRIYQNRPYVCRTQGLPLRWLDEVDGEIVEYRDICPLNEAGEPIETLFAEECWSIGSVEERLARMQSELQPEMNGGSLRRTGLRDLFKL